MEVDILDFLVPEDNNQTLFVWDIQPSTSEAQVYEGLFNVFSSFGPLYQLRVRQNAPLSPPGFYALIKFYSAGHASKAQRWADGRSLFQNTPLKVRLSAKHTPHSLSDNRTPLSYGRCLELANYYLGFNGWTSDIITLKELINKEEEEDEEDGRRRRSLRFGCVLQLSFPHHRQTTRAAAVVEDSFTCSGPDVLLQRRCSLMRRVAQRALVQAFASVLLILLGDGKVMVAVRQTSDQLLPEQTEQVLQINELAPDEEEEEEDEVWDLTVP